MPSTPPMFSIWTTSPGASFLGRCPEYPKSALRWPSAPATTSPRPTFAMRPLVSSSVLYCDLLVRISTASTMPSSQGMALEIRSSFDRPQACVTEAILSTMIEPIAGGFFGIAAGLVLDPVLDVEGLLEARLGGHRPAVADRIAQLQRVDLLHERDTVTDIEPRRQVFSEHELGAGIRVLRDADVVEADVLAELPGEERAALLGGAEVGVLGAGVALDAGAADDQHRGDLRLRQARLGEQRELRLAQRPARDHADLVARQLARGAEVDAGIRDRASREDEATALDLELAAVGLVFAFLDLELAGTRRALGRRAARADRARHRRGEAVGLHLHLLAEREAYVARDRERRAFARRGLGLHDALVGGRQHGVGGVGRHDARLRD